MGFYGFANWVPTLLIKQGITMTTSLMYSSVIALAAPLGPLIGLFIGDRFERKTVIVVMAAREYCLRAVRSARRRARCCW